MIGSCLDCKPAREPMAGKASGPRGEPIATLVLLVSNLLINTHPCTYALVRGSVLIRTGSLCSAQRLTGRLTRGQSAGNKCLWRTQL